MKQVFASSVFACSAALYAGDRGGVAIVPIPSPLPGHTTVRVDTLSQCVSALPADSALQVVSHGRDEYLQAYIGWHRKSLCQGLGCRSGAQLPAAKQAVVCPGASGELRLPVNRCSAKRTAWFPTPFAPMRGRRLFRIFLTPSVLFRFRGQRPRVRLWHVPGKAGSRCAPGCVRQRSWLHRVPLVGLLFAIFSAQPSTLANRTTFHEAFPYRPSVRYRSPWSRRIQAGYRLRHRDRSVHR